MIEFDDLTHTYRLDGAVLPSVTQVIQSAGLVDGIEWFTEESAQRGTAVHIACHYLDEGDLDSAWMDRNPEHAGYVRAWERFKVESQFDVDLIEKTVHSPLGYCGRLDRTGTLGQSVVCNALVDIKTGPRQRWHALQTSAYAATFHSPRKYHRLTVHLRQDGSYDVREHPIAEYAEDFGVFIAALKLWQWREKGNVNSGSRAAA